MDGASKTEITYEDLIGIWQLHEIILEAQSGTLVWALHWCSRDENKYKK